MKEKNAQTGLPWDQVSFHTEEAQLLFAKREAPTQLHFWLPAHAVPPLYFFPFSL